MSFSKDAVLHELRRIKGPDLEGNIVDLGLVSEILIKDQKVYFSITVPAVRAEELEPLRKAAETVVAKLPGVAGVTAVLTAEAPAGAASRPKESTRVSEARARGATGNGSGAHTHGPGHSHAPAAGAQSGTGPKPMAEVPGVKSIIAVASGKGGVGKSTVAVNLALGFAAAGKKVGILDADIYGPSQPRLLGLKGQPQVVSGKTLRRLEA